MRYKAVVSCTDFDGRFFHKGEIVDLPEGKHSDFLVPLDAPAPSEAENETPESADTEAEVAGETLEVTETEAEAADEELEVNAQQGAIALFTEDALKAKTKVELVELAGNCFGLVLNVKAKEAELIAAILGAQATISE